MVCSLLSSASAASAFPKEGKKVVRTVDAMKGKCDCGALIEKDSPLPILA